MFWSEITFIDKDSVKCKEKPLVQLGIEHHLLTSGKNNQSPTIFLKRFLGFELQSQSDSDSISTSKESECRDQTSNDMAALEEDLKEIAICGNDLNCS